jgi:hypothetical protein
LISKKIKKSKLKKMAQNNKSFKNKKLIVIKNKQRDFSKKNDLLVNSFIIVELILSKKIAFLIILSKMPL